MQKRNILVIDDEVGVSGSVHQRAFLRRYASLNVDFVFEACEDTTSKQTQALASIARNGDMDIVLLDLRFGVDEDRVGYEMLTAITTHFPGLPVLVMSSVERDVQGLARCLEGGACGFVQKGLDSHALEQAIESAICMAQSHAILGRSAALQALRRQAARLSPYDKIPVLIVGERGTGKERVARHIHHNGPRAEKPFIAVNCAGIPESLLEGELFGSEKGAYTGANELRKGYIERAHGGVLFLDEIGDTPIATQAKLLRVLQDGAFRRVGVSEEEVKSDFQIICATNIEPETLIAEGRLREDFYDRVAAVIVRTPPLRDCLEDIPELANHFLRQLGLDGRKRFSNETLRVLQEYRWPGNVRELQRVVQAAVVLSEDDPVINACCVPKKCCGVAPTEPMERAIQPALSLSAEHPVLWPSQRIETELVFALEVKRRVKKYKGNQWKAEFMRIMYPECRAQNAKGFGDLIKRLTQGPWGCSSWKDDKKLSLLLEELIK